MRLWKIEWQSELIEQRRRDYPNICGEYDMVEYELRDEDAYDDLLSEYGDEVTDIEQILITDVTDEEPINLGRLQDILHGAGYSLPLIVVVSDAVEKSYDNIIN